MNHQATLLPTVIEAVKSVAPKQRGMIGPTTQLLTELDLDSLQLLELITIMKDKFGTDFLAANHSLEELHTPETIVAAILKEQVK